MLGTILFEVITGKRAFYHQQPDKARGLVLSATSKTIERARLNPEQRQLIESLHQIEPGDRLVGVREFQGKVRELFQDQNRFPRDFPNTSEHPALYVKESLPEAPEIRAAAGMGGAVQETCGSGRGEARHLLNKQSIFTRAMM